MENSPVPESETSSQTTNTIKSKNLLVIASLVIILVLALGVSYYLYSGSSTSSITESSSPATGEFLTESVQTFTASSSMFTLQYPKGWVPYVVKGGDTSLGGVNIFPAESIPTYQANNKLSFDWTAYALPFDQHNGDYPMISIGGQATFDSFTNRGQYDFKTTPLYKGIQDYVNGWKIQGQFKNVQITDTLVGGEPALVITYDVSSKNSKVFYMIKLAKDAITEKLPMTAYFIVQYIAPKDQYSDVIANTLLASFQDDLAGASARSMTEYEQKNQSLSVAPSASSQGNTWQVLFVGDKLSHEVNWIEFDYKYTDPKGAEGLLTVQWDAKRIGSLDGRLQRQGHESFGAPIGKVYRDALFDLGFRLDSFTSVPSSISIGNIGLYYLDPTKLGSITKVADVLPEDVSSQKSPSEKSFGTITLVNKLETPSMTLRSTGIKIGQTVDIDVREFPYTGYTYISLNQPGKSKNTIWVGLVPSNNFISFTLENKTCPAPHPISACSVPLIDLVPGKYTLEVYKPGDDINLTSDFQVLSQ